MSWFDEIEQRLAEQRLADTKKKADDLTMTAKFGAEQTKYNTEKGDDLAMTAKFGAEQTMYNIEKADDLAMTAKFGAEQLKANRLAETLRYADIGLHSTDKLLQLKTAQHMVLQEKLKKKRQENREMLHKISTQDDELAKVESELQQCLVEQRKLKKELTPTLGPFKLGEVKYPEQKLDFHSSNQYIRK
jgi:hypothetical protein